MEPAPDQPDHIKTRKRSKKCGLFRFARKAFDKLRKGKHARPEALHCSPSSARILRHGESPIAQDEAEPPEDIRSQGSSAGYASALDDNVDDDEEEELEGSEGGDQPSIDQSAEEFIAKFHQQLRLEIALEEYFTSSEED